LRTTVLGESFCIYTHNIRMLYLIYGLNIHCFVDLNNCTQIRVHNNAAITIFNLTFQYLYNILYNMLDKKNNTWHEFTASTQRQGCHFLKLVFHT